MRYCVFVLCSVEKIFCTSSYRNNIFGILVEHLAEHDPKPRSGCVMVGEAHLDPSRQRLTFHKKLLHQSRGATTEERSERSGGSVRDEKFSLKGPKKTESILLATKAVEFILSQEINPIRTEDKAVYTSSSSSLFAILVHTLQPKDVISTMVLNSRL